MKIAWLLYAIGSACVVVAAMAFAGPVPAMLAAAAHLLFAALVIGALDFKP